MARKPKHPGEGEQPGGEAFDAAFFGHINPEDLPKRVRRTDEQPDGPVQQAWQDAAPDVAIPETSKPAQPNIRLENVDFEVKNYNPISGIVTLVVVGDNPHLVNGMIYEIDFKTLRPLLINYQHVGDIENPHIKTGDGLDGITVFVKPNGEMAIKPNLDIVEIESIQFVKPKNEIRFGVVKFYNDSTGSGYIAPEKGGRDMYVDASAVEILGGALVSGQRLSYQVVFGPNGPRAVNLQRQETRPQFKPRGQDPKGNEGQS